MSKVLYVSGKMAGEKDYGKLKFSLATQRLRRAGYYVINPSENWGCPGPGVIPRTICMKMDLQQVLMSEGLATLNDWRDSPGAQMEVDVADACGITVMSVDAWLAAAEASTPGVPFPDITPFLHLDGATD